jgi:hypothetical protein
MSCLPTRRSLPTLASAPAEPWWTAAPGPAERTLRRLQGLLVDTGRDPATVVADVRAVLAEAGYPTDVLGGVDEGVAADIFGG